MDHYGTCSNNIREVCQRHYALEGSVLTPAGLKKCREQLREKDKWGYDRSLECKKDPEKCNHTGCGYVVDAHSFKDYADLVRQQEPEMKKASDVYREKASQKMVDMQGKFKGFISSFGKKPEPAQAGGRRRRTRRKHAGEEPPPIHLYEALRAQKLGQLGSRHKKGGRRTKKRKTRRKTKKRTSKSHRRR